METEKYMELDAAIRCGELACLQACCADGKLPTVMAALRGLNVTDLPLLTKMLCGCAVPPGTTITGNACFESIIGFARRHTTTVSTLQNILLAIGSLGIPAVDTAVQVVLIALEQIEDAAQADASDTTVLQEAVRSVCSAVQNLRGAAAQLDGRMPGASSSATDFLQELLFDAAAFVTCCDDRGPAPERPQLPGTGGTTTPGGGAPAPGGAGSGTVPASTGGASAPGGLGLPPPPTRPGCVRPGCVPSGCVAVRLEQQAIVRS